MENLFNFSIRRWDDSLCVTKKNGDATCFGEDLCDEDCIDSYFEDLPGYTRFGFSENVGSYDGYLTGVKLIKVGDDFGCVVYLNGNLRCWGDDYAYFSDVADAPLPISFYSNAIDVGVTRVSHCLVEPIARMYTYT